MTMKNDQLEDLGKLPTSPSARQGRLRALLFAGAALGTTLLLSATISPKLPPYQGE
jgi:hypothetical protein